MAAIFQDGDNVLVTKGEVYHSKLSFDTKMKSVYCTSTTGTCHKKRQTDEQSPNSALLAHFFYSFMNIVEFLVVVVSVVLEVNSYWFRIRPKNSNFHIK